MPILAGFFAGMIWLMNTAVGRSRLLVLFLAARPKFLTASAAPVLVGTAIGYAVSGTFEPVLFVLALFAAMALHSGANIANDYYDHLSGNDWGNRNVTPFSGGRQFIQQGIISPKATLLASLFCLTIGATLGLVILLMTQSIFILVLGIIGLLGGFFYTAPPVKLGYRGIGEIVIAFLFGILPVYGSYYLQTRTIDFVPLPAGLIVGVLIFLVILVNEFPDRQADAAVNKKTLVVCFGVPASAWIYRIILAVSYLIAGAGVFASRPFLYAGIAYFLTLPLAIAAMRSANAKDLSTPGQTQHRASSVTVIMHLVGCVAVTAGYVLSVFFHR